MNTLKFNQIEFNHIGEQPTSSIKLQEKSVTITKNGTTEIVPDSGYALEKVRVETGVTIQPYSEYYEEYLTLENISGVDSFYRALLMSFSSFVNMKCISGDGNLFIKGQRYIYPSAYIINADVLNNFDTHTARLLIHPKKKILFGGEYVYVDGIFKAYLSNINIEYSEILITKEEFYDLTTD